MEGDGQSWVHAGHASSRHACSAAWAICLLLADCAVLVEWPSRPAPSALSSPSPPPHSSRTVPTPQLVCAIFSFVNLYMYIVYLPFYKPIVNLTNILHGCVFASATMMFSCSYLRGVPEVRVCACALRAQAPHI